MNTRDQAPDKPDAEKSVEETNPDKTQKQE
jgi:hypothetical protein